MNISEASSHSGVSAKMIRHYEDIGLLPRAKRSMSNYRRYEDGDIHELRFIKRSRDLGFSTAEIKELLGLWRNKARPSAAVKKIAGKHVEDLQAKIAQLRTMVVALEHLSGHCHGDHRPNCPILDDLAR